MIYPTMLFAQLFTHLIKKREGTHSCTLFSPRVFLVGIRHLYLSARRGAGPGWERDGKKTYGLFQNTITFYLKILRAFYIIIFFNYPILLIL